MRHPRPNAIFCLLMIFENKYSASIEYSRFHCSDQFVGFYVFVILGCLRNNDTQIIRPLTLLLASNVMLPERFIGRLKESIVCGFA